MTQQDAIIGHIRALIRDLEPHERREVLSRIVSDFVEPEFRQAILDGKPMKPNHDYDICGVLGCTGECESWQVAKCDLCGRTLSQVGWISNRDGVSVCGEGCLA